MLSVLLLSTAFLSLQANVIHNGAFDSGTLPPWRCNGCHCSTDRNYLAVTQRKATWGGPRQNLQSNIFSSDELQYQLNFSLQALQPMVASWKLHVISGEEEKYFSLFHDDISSSEWTDWSTGVIIDSSVLGADTVELYFEATPDTADFNLDNIVMAEFGSDDSWQEEADSRIDKIRKNNVQFNLIDVEAAELSIEVSQLSHRFPFGQAVVSNTIAACYDAGVDDNYCSYVGQNFNWMVDTYRMKWKAMEPHKGDFEVETPDKMIAWGVEKDIRVRGHSLLWAKTDNNPSWTWALSEEEFIQAVYKHVDDTLDHFDGLGVKHWDVINEMVDQGQDNHTFYIDHSGDPDIRAKIYSHVKERYPATQFYVNDYGILVNNQNRFHLFQQLLRDLLAAGAPIDAIGVQSHLHGNDFLNWMKMKERLDLLWEEFHLPVWVTEFDWNGEGSQDFGDHSHHAEVLDNFYRLMFSHQAIHGILSWRTDTLNSDGTPNKAGQAYINLYQSEWRTDLVIKQQQAQTSSAFRGFQAPCIL